MEENLVGFLLHALDPDAKREVENYLVEHPEAKEQLNLLRQALAPLEADDEEFDPPADLRFRTLARVAEYRSRELLSFSLPVAPSRSAVSPRTWWRRADVLIAASILLLATPLLIPALSSMRNRFNIVACQNNLRGFHQALMAYSTDHLGALPKVEERPPHNYAGIVIPALRGGGYLTDAISVRCPTNGFQSASTASIEMLDEELDRDPSQFEKDIALLAGCYGYSLGYRANGQLCGLRRVPGNGLMIIMSDRPPFSSQDSVFTLSNSPNHGGVGQNILRMDGSVEFATTRNVGVDLDDIFVDRFGIPRAGCDPDDTVIGKSDSRSFLDLP